MRFVLDNDVVVAVGKVLRRQGHQCWSVDNAHLAASDDDNVGVYADNKDARLITHDKDLAARRKKDLWGQVIHLDCPHPYAAEIVKIHLESILQGVENPKVVVVRVSREGVRIQAPRWLADS